MLSLFAAATILFSGCTQMNRLCNGSPGEPVVQCAKPDAQPCLRKDGYVVSVINDHYYTLEKFTPETTAIGQTVDFKYVLTPRVYLKDVVVQDSIPSGASYVDSFPLGEVVASSVAWKFNELFANVPVEIVLKIKAEESGELLNCATVTATPVACGCVSVGEPILMVTKEGPSCARVGDMVQFQVFVKNTGNYTADNVVLIDTLPEGLCHESGKHELRLDVGTLCPGESRSATICLEACHSGEQCNVIQAVSSNAGSQKAKSCITISQPALEISKIGPREEFVGKRASYSIVVTNAGDMDLNDVVVKDSLPNGCQFVEAPGASVRGNELIWSISTLPVGQSMNFSALCDGDLMVSAQSKTLWKGFPELSMAATSCNGLSCGDCLEYQIQVSNTGSAAESNVKLVAEFSDELMPLSAEGPSVGRVNGKMVEFEPFSYLNSGEMACYSISLQGKQAGSASVNLKLTSASMPNGLEANETVRVY